MGQSTQRPLCTVHFAYASELNQSVCFQLLENEELLHDKRNDFASITWEWFKEQTQ
jgi:hypothetical protein